MREAKDYNVLGVNVHIPELKDEPEHLSLEQRLNEAPGELPTFGGACDCQVCRNKGVIYIEESPGSLRARECECMKKRRTLARLGRSGLEDVVLEKTFKAFQTPDDFTVDVKSLAKGFCTQSVGRWFFVSGHPGTGKTHICTAICGQLIGKRPVQYINWRDEARSLKALVMDSQMYTERITELKSVPVLYIDDFLKGKVTEADLNLAFELLNARYISKSSTTIISSERTLDEIDMLDISIGGRIRERSAGYAASFPPEAKDWRAAKE